MSAHEQYRAEVAVKRVIGVTAVANDFAVRAPLGGMPTDLEIARDAVIALKLELPFDWENIKPIVKEGHMTWKARSSGMISASARRPRCGTCGVLSGAIPSP